VFFGVFFKCFRDCKMKNSTSDTKDLQHHARPKLNTPHPCLQRTIKARGATSSKSPMKATLPKPLRSPNVCKLDATTWTEVVCHRRAGSACWSPKFSIQTQTITLRPHPSPAQHLRSKISRLTNSICKNELVSRQRYITTNLFLGS
jgi:hypothetical protein